MCTLYYRCRNPLCGREFATYQGLKSHITRKKDCSDFGYEVIRISRPSVKVQNTWKGNLKHCTAVVYSRVLSCTVVYCCVLLYTVVLCTVVYCCVLLCTLYDANCYEFVFCVLLPLYSLVYRGNSIVVYCCVCVLLCAVFVYCCVLLSTVVYFEYWCILVCTVVCSCVLLCTLVYFTAVCCCVLLCAL